MVLTSERRYNVPKTPGIKAIYLKNYVIHEMARFYKKEISDEDVDMLHPKTFLDKEVFRNIRIDKLENCFSIN